MNLDKKKLESRLPAFFSELILEVSKQGFTLVLIGGSVRDFFLTGELGTDWDVELYHDSLAFNRNHWKDFGKSLGQFGKVTHLPYDIIRLEMNSHQIEFSPPREEKFLENEKGHSNFEAVFNFKLPFEDAVKRRDFTVNALGIKFFSPKNFQLMDPLNGLVHLRDKILHYAGPDFAKDPIRYLRAHRFAQKLGFEFSPELKKILSEMDTSEITPSYLWSEIQKSGDGINFLKRLLTEKEIHPELKLPVEDTFALKLTDLKKVLSETKRHESWIIALEWLNISSEGWAKFFSLSSDTSKRLGRWANASRDFQKIMPETYHGEFDQLKDDPNFEKIFDWYFTTKQLLQKNPDLPLMGMIEEYLPHWIHLYKFDPVKDVKHIDPPYRAKYQVWNLCQRL